MIAKGTDPVALSKLLAHSHPSTTLDEYGWLWDEHRNAEEIRERG
jgi:hypothetical protein